MFRVQPVPSKTPYHLGVDSFVHVGLHHAEVSFQSSLVVAQAVHLHGQLADTRLRLAQFVLSMLTTTFSILEQGSDLFDFTGQLNSFAFTSLVRIGSNIIGLYIVLIVYSYYE